ncbi:enhanced level of genomic instability 1 [Anopheles nili]|uniref:enhanced level of genomic instability 1 n=1 Tax=Anopheles nili TaxID=185578 RepID=UPI00237C43D3|nr:enhanced level of genomic instability 1 [Anopheles nili]
MASVLKSIKKRKHAKKHARLRQAATTEQNASADKMSGNKGNKQDGTLVDHMDRKDKSTSKSRKCLNMKERNSTAVKETKTKPQAHSLKEVQPEVKNESILSAGITPNPPSMEKGGKENKTINAFQLMMTARSKCIGSNSPGRDRDAPEMSPSQQVAREQKAKRTLLLQEWAAQKGGGKRKLQEVAEDDYIEHQLKKRTKRLKKLISNMSTKEDDGDVITEEPAVEVLQLDVIEILESQSSSEVVLNGKQHEQQTKTTSSGEKSPAERNVNGKANRKKIRPRSRKIKADTPKEQDEEPAIIDIDDNSNEEFLKHLSSPRKKKDSLLGYFAKVTPETRKKHSSSPSQCEKPSTPTSNASQVKKTHTTPPSDANTPTTDANVDTSPVPQGSSRPRRSCANRIKDYSAFEKYSPAKEEQRVPSKKPPIVTPLKIINVQSPNAMKVVKSPSLRMFSSANGEAFANGTKSSPLVDGQTTPKTVKLAPVFARTAGGKPLPAIDPEKARARQMFLMSGIPEKMRQEMEKRATYIEHVLNESPVFPLVSHVTQLTEQTREKAAPSLRESIIKVRPADQESPSARTMLKNIKNRKIRFGMFTTCSENDFEEAMEKCNLPIDLDSSQEQPNDDALPEVENVKEIVRDYKKRYPHFPVFRCYKQFRAVYHDHQKAQESEPEQLCETATKGNGKATPEPLDDSVVFVETSCGFRNGELLFTEKYRPQKTEQILINFSPANQLTQFLSLWQDEATSGRRTNGGGDYFASNSSEMDGDFYEHSNGSTASSSVGSNVCNHVVLVGPPGCGKTCNVYAVAQDMNFNVLEINASSRRKGKIILQELLEATQSHQVRQKSERSNSVDGLLGRLKGGKKAGPGGSVLRCLERRPSLNDTNGIGSKKLSLILIEDADIVFEQDDGFLGAINQLIATSKRPIVLTTTNPSCSHMARYMARNNVIRYVAPGIGNVAKFLSLLALVERIPIDQHELGRLYAYNEKDMRKTVNELQFFVQSGGDIVRFQSSNGLDRSRLEFDEELNTALNETREEDSEQAAGLDDQPATKASKGRRKRAKNDQDTQSQHHASLYELFTRNQNEEMIMRLPLEFDALWSNMELVLRSTPNDTPPERLLEKGRGKSKRNGTPGRRKRGADDAADEKKSLTPPDVARFEELSFLYENISRAEAGWGVTQRNRIRYGKDPQDEQQQQQVANEMGHALVEGSWMRWFKGSKQSKNEPYTGAKAYDALRKVHQEPRQTIASHIGVNSVRSRVVACDYEPLLRQICRYERDRSMQERRGSRFYHYFRNFGTSNAPAQQQLMSMAAIAAGGFSVDNFDALSHCFEEQPVNQPVNPPEQNGIDGANGE